MPKPHNPLHRRDLLKLLCLLSAMLSIASVFVFAPSFSSPIFFSLVVTILLSPAVASLERKGFSRGSSILLLFFGFGILFGIVGVGGIQAIHSEWSSFQLRAPHYFESSIAQLTHLEEELKTRYPFLNFLHITESILKWGPQTGQWFLDHGPEIMSHVLSLIFIVPFLSFIFLNEGPAFRRYFYQLVPNRYFESFFLMSNDIFIGLSDYFRAKLLEALLVGLIATLGLALVGAPYAAVFGILCGITNIIPYLGPLIAAIPTLMVVGFDSPAGSTLVYSVSAVLIFTNLIDMTVIFPLVVAKLVRLHPLVLILAVSIGQHYYGLLGMLVSIPVATILKVILQEIYFAVYQQNV